MGDCCGHLDNAHLEQAQRRVLQQVLVINLATFAVMVAGSVHSGSSALLSGTLDNLGDALTYAVSLAMISASRTAKAQVALLKGLLILLAACAVAAQIIWRLTVSEAPIVASMSIAAVLNLFANGICLMLLHPFRHQDINMSSVWECSRNDVFEGVAVICAAAAVWLTESFVPDVLVAAALLVLFSRSAVRVLRSALKEMHAAREEPTTVST